MSGPLGSNSTIGRTVLDQIMHKQPSTRKLYRVTLIVPENGIPVIEYRQARGSASKKKLHKTIHFVDLWYADRRHDTNEKNAFSVYLVDKTVTFLAPDETTMNEWLTKIREYHSNLYPELTQYDAIFEANLLERGLGKTMNIQGPYRLALCKESLDLVPLLTPAMLEQLQQRNLSKDQRFSKRHPWVSQKTIQLARRFIRRCGHTDSNFYIESGRLSTVGEGGLWFALNKKSTAKHLHELLLATIKTAASQNDDQFLCKAPRSRSGSSSDNSHYRSQQSRSSSLICLNNNNSNSNNNNNTHISTGTSALGTVNNLNDQIATPMDEDCGYLPMA